MIKYFDKASLMEAESFYRRDLVNSLSGYKSLNLIGTKNKDGISNLSPFSQIFHVGASPPLVGILFRPHTVRRHSLENILETGYFTLNHVAEEFYKKAHQTAARYECSEFDAVGLREEFLGNFFSPYVKESKVKMGCSLTEHQQIKSNDTVLIIGAIEHVYVDSVGLREDGSLDLESMGTVTVSGLDDYFIGKRLARLSYPKPNTFPEEI